MEKAIEGSNSEKNRNLLKIESGIGGLDPRIHASRKVGKKAVALIVDKIGKKAQELLA